MAVVTRQINIKTKRENDMVDLTPQVAKELSDTKISDGIVTIFCMGSTGVISTVEFEPGLQNDVPEALERIAPKDLYYKHHETWHDDNGRGHVKATLVGPGITVPFVKGRLTLGAWQQICFIECDTRARSRDIVLQFIGE